MSAPLTPLGPVYARPPHAPDPPLDLLKPLPRHPGYGISPEGDVWSLRTPSRGKFAGFGPRILRANVHPRGQHWTVMVQNESGIRERVAVWRLLREAFGPGHVSLRFPAPVVLPD